MFDDYEIELFIEPKLLGVLKYQRYSDQCTRTQRIYADSRLEYFDQDIWTRMER